MTREERELALYCLKASSDYHSEVCEECVNYPNCDHAIQDDVTEIIIKALEQKPILDKIRAEINEYQPNTGDTNLDYAYDCGLGKALEIIDKYKAKSEE